MRPGFEKKKSTESLFPIRNPDTDRRKLFAPSGHGNGAWKRFSSSLIGVIPGLTGRDFSTPTHAKNEEKVCETNSCVEIGWICI